jgi:acyl-coenzyme A thioesterase PaaI-like protein
VDVELPPPHPEAPAPGTVVGQHYARCFGCGDEQEHGLHMRSTIADSRTVSARFTVTEAHQGAPGLAHGGLLACAFDEALGTTIGHLLRQPAVTGRLETEFVRPVPVGSTLFITAALQGLTGRRVFASADGRLDAEDGPVAVRARATFVVVPFSHFKTHGPQEDLDAVAKDPGLIRSRNYDINP